MEKDKNGLLEINNLCDIGDNRDDAIIDAKHCVIQYSQTYNVRIPKAEDTIVMNVSVIKNIRRICENAKKEHFSLAELFGGISTLLLGGFISALISQIPYNNSQLSFFLYTICPSLGLGFGVAYFFSRKKRTNDLRQFAEIVETQIKMYNEDEDGDPK